MRKLLKSPQAEIDLLDVWLSISIRINMAKAPAKSKPELEAV